METKIIIQRIPLGDFQVNTYLVACGRTRKAVLIDPAGESKRLITEVESNKIRVVYILNTHGHADHVAANKELKAKFTVPVCMHEADDRFFSDPENRDQAENELGSPPPDPADIRLKDGDTLAVGDLNITVIHTPGHTPGSVCFHVLDNLFTGDTLFVGDVGRADPADGSLDSLLDSLEKKIIPLPPHTRIWPGHDYGETPTSTIAREMEENPYITDFILDKE